MKYMDDILKRFQPSLQSVYDEDYDNSVLCLLDLRKALYGSDKKSFMAAQEIESFLVRNNICWLCGNQLNVKRGHIFHPEVDDFEEDNILFCPNCGINYTEAIEPDL